MSRWFEKVFVVIVLLLAGCASVNNTQSPAQTRENILDAQEKWLRGFDTVVLAAGVTPDNSFGLELSKTMQNVHLIGDCESPADYRKAIHDAAQIAIAI